MDKSNVDVHDEAAVVADRKDEAVLTRFTR